MYHSFKTFKSSIGSSTGSGSSSVGSGGSGTGGVAGGSAGSGVAVSGFYAGNDPFCPLGFHPQVRWPSRCKRCFRDYKEHEARKTTSDSRSNERIAVATTNSEDKKTGWSNRRTHSLDYTIDENSEPKTDCEPDDRTGTETETDKDESDGMSEVSKTVPTSWISSPDLSKLSDDCKPSVTVASVPTVNFTLPATRRSKLVKQMSTGTANSNGHESPSLRSETLRKIRNENDELKNRVDNLTEKYATIEREKDELLAKYFDVCSTAANDSSKSLKKFSNEILCNLQENCKTYRTQNDDLTRAKQTLEKRCARLEQQLQFERNHEALRNQLQATETLCEELLGENHDIKKEIKDLEDELDEMQDSFCDDFHSDEFHNLRKDLEQSNKNCRILSFKLRKSEKQKDLLETKKVELEQKIDSINDAKSILMQADRIREQEEQLNLSNQLIIQLQNDILLLTAAAAGTDADKVTATGTGTATTAAATRPKLESIGRISSADGIKVSRESLIRSNSQEDPIQLYRDLQDSIEREFDFKEQLKYSEEESQYLRKKLTRLEDENESLMLQLKKMCSKSAYSKTANGHEPIAVTAVTAAAAANASDFENGDDENSSNTELKVLLDLNEQECSSLRKKVTEYESEIDILRGKLKEFEDKINKKKCKLKKSLFEHHESNDSETSKKLKRKSLIKSRSLDTDELTIDYKCQLKAVEQEVSVLRTKIQSLENENEKLIGERNKLQSICNRKKSSVSKVAVAAAADSPDKLKSLSDQLEKLEMEKMESDRKLKMFVEQSNTPPIRTLLERATKNSNELQTKSQLRKHIHELESEIGNFLVVLQRVDNRNRSLETDLQSMRANDNFEHQIANLNCELMAKNNDIKKLQDLNELQRNELQAKLEMSERRLDEARKSEAETKCKLEKLENECLLIKSRDNYDLENQIERLKEKLLRFEKVDKESKNVQLQYEQKIREIQTLEKELGHYTTQCGNLKRENDELRLKLNDFHRLMAVQTRTNEQTVRLQDEIVRLQNELNESERNRNQVQAELSEKYENQTNMLSNEIKMLEAQIERIKKEKSLFRDTLDAAHKNGLSAAGIVDVNSNDTSKSKIKHYEDQIYSLENELSETKEQYSKLQMTLLNERSASDLQLAQLKSKLNELDEDRILTSGRSKLIGLKTRLELAWQKERNEQQRLLQENATLARDLRQTLFEIERERDKERLENRRKLDQMKKISEREADENQTRTVRLQQTVNEVRDSQAKLRAQNEKLRADLDRFEQLKAIETRFVRSIQSLFDKLVRLFQQMPEFNGLLNSQTSKTDLRDFGGIPIAPPKRRKAAMRDEQTTLNSLSSTSSLVSVTGGNDTATKTMAAVSSQSSSSSLSSFGLAKEICRLVDDLRSQLQTKIALVTTLAATTTTATSSTLIAHGNRPKLHKKSTSLDHPSYAVTNHPHSSLALLASNNSFKNFFVNNYHSSVQSLQNFGELSPNYSLVDGTISYNASVSLTSITSDDQQAQSLRSAATIDSSKSKLQSKTKTLETAAATSSARLSNDSIQSEIAYTGSATGCVTEVRKKKSIFGRFKKLTKSKSVDHNDFKGDGMDFKDKFATMIRKASKLNSTSSSTSKS